MTASDGLEPLTVDGVHPWPGADAEPLHAIRLSARHGERLLVIRADTPTAQAVRTAKDRQTSFREAARAAGARLTRVVLAGADHAHEPRARLEGEVAGKRMEQEEPAGKAIALALAAEAPIYADELTVVKHGFRPDLPEQAKACGVTDERVLKALTHIDRATFMPASIRVWADVDAAFPIGRDQTISQPSLVAKITELLEVGPGDTVLEVGTGTGYQAALLARLAARVYSIEIIEELARTAAERLKELGLTNTRIKHADGWDGWSADGPFDAIVVSCAAPNVPEPLLAQLKPNGRMIVPIRMDHGHEDLTLVRKDQDGKPTFKKVLDVWFVPMTGAHGLDRSKAQPLQAEVEREIEERVRREVDARIRGEYFKTHAGPREPWDKASADQLEVRWQARMSSPSSVELEVVAVVDAVESFERGAVVFGDQKGRHRVVTWTTNHAVNQAARHLTGLRTSGRLLTALIQGAQTVRRRVRGAGQAPRWLHVTGVPHQPELPNPCLLAEFRNGSAHLEIPVSPDSVMPVLAALPASQLKGPESPQSETGSGSINLAPRLLLIRNWEGLPEFRARRQMADQRESEESITMATAVAIAVRYNVPIEPDAAAWAAWGWGV